MFMQLQLSEGEGKEVAGSKTFFQGYFAFGGTTLRRKHFLSFGASTHCLFVIDFLYTLYLHKTANWLSLITIEHPTFTLQPAPSFNSPLAVTLYVKATQLSLQPSSSVTPKMRKSLSKRCFNQPPNHCTVYKYIVDVNIISIFNIIL